MKRFHIILILIGLVLVVPLIGSQVSSEINWNLIDYLLAACLLLGTGVLIELILRKFKSTKKKLIYSIIILIVLFLIWAELAVGIIGISPTAN